MKRTKHTTFWGRLALYLLPFLLGLGCVLGWLTYIGETMPLRLVATIQQGDQPTLFRIRYGNRDQQYKQLATNMRQPDVLVIGSSRVLQFRAGFLTEAPHEFYNAAGPAWRLEQVYNLLTSLSPAAHPQILILGIDPPWFNEHYQGDTFPPARSDFDHAFAVGRAFTQDVLTNETFDYVAYTARIEPGSGSALALGMRAIRDGHGFRNDGSEQFGDFLVANYLWQPQMRSHHLDQMRAGEDVYVYGDTVSQRALDQMYDLLQWAQANEIAVIGFFPPYTPELWTEMMARGNHSYILKLKDDLQPMFAAFDYPLLDYSNGADIGLSEEDFFDGWHASERATLQLFINLLEQTNTPLSHYTHIDNLRAIRQNATDTWSVFGLG